jgi:hypothetical protein
MKKLKANYVWDPQKKEKKYVEERLIPKFDYGHRAYHFARDEATKNLKRK